MLLPLPIFEPILLRIGIIIQGGIYLYTDTIMVQMKLHFTQNKEFGLALDGTVQNCDPFSASSYFIIGGAYEQSTTQLVSGFNGIIHTLWVYEEVLHNSDLDIFFPSLDCLIK
jgi:hypothetical protein